MVDNPASSTNSRAASPAIAGYAYQFDKTIIEILRADDASTVTVEGCEDVDLHSATETTAVQCKYHSAARFSLAGIRHPLLLMLRAFAAGQRCRYHLYAHYGDSSSDPVPSRLTLANLKTALTEDKRKPRRTVRHYDQFDDATLAAFVECFSAEAGPPLDEQRKNAVVALQDALSSAEEDVADLHYPNAFLRVMQLAMASDPAVRQTTRSEFISALDTQRTMFTRWHRAFLGQQRYLKAVKRQIDAQGLLRTTIRRVLYLGPDEIDSETATTRLSDLLSAIARLGFGPGTLSNALPWTVILDADDSRSGEIKAAVLDHDVAINDGYEAINFRRTLFDQDPLTYVNGSRVARTSYDLRIVRSATIAQHPDALTHPLATLAFATDLPAFATAHSASRHLAIPGCSTEQIADVLGAFR